MKLINGIFINKRRPLFIGFAAGLLLVVFGASIAYAQEPTPVIPDDAVNAIASQMYCPVCENIPLDVCGTQACQQWRELIREKLSQGWTEAQIKDYFATQYGDRVLAEPPRRGLNWIVYLVPPLAILAGFFLVYRVVRSWQHPQGDGKLPVAATDNPTEQKPVVDEYSRRIEEELRKRQ